MAEREVGRGGHDGVGSGTVKWDDSRYIYLAVGYIQTYMHI